MNMKWQSRSEGEVDVWVEVCKSGLLIWHASITDMVAVDMQDN